MHSGKGLDMTTGSPWRLLIAFSMPLLMGNVFQQLYNTVDSYVVGNYVSKEALAAVGSVGSIINTLIGFFSGLASGAGVVVSQYFGARDKEMVRKTVETSVIMTLAMCVLFTALGILTAPMMLRFMSTPEDVWEDAKQYLTIYFAGATGLMMYNIGAGLLQAVGNTKMPLIALIISAVTNVVLDLVFVVCFQMGVAGVAWATVIAELVSAVFVIVVLMTADGPHRLNLFHMHFYGKIFRKVFSIGIPSAVQMAITAFSNVFVQGYINNFGSDCMAGWTVYSKIDAFAMLPMSCVAAACTTYAGQNLGAGKWNRIHEGRMVTQKLSFITCIAALIPVVLFREQLVAFFNDDPGVIYYGGTFLLCITPAYLVGCIANPMNSVLRGCGETRGPMVFMIGSFVVFRQIYLAVLTRITDSFLVIGFAYPAGWLVNLISTWLYFRLSKWKKRCLIPQSGESSGA